MHHPLQLLFSVTCRQTRMIVAFGLNLGMLEKMISIAHIYIAYDLTSGMIKLRRFSMILTMDLPICCSFCL